MEFDDRYINLISLYKKLRADPDRGHLAEKAFEASEKLVKENKVSAEAREAARYI
jgi:hypothetical protein